MKRILIVMPVVLFMMANAQAESASAEPLLTYAEALKSIADDQVAVDANALMKFALECDAKYTVSETIGSLLIIEENWYEWSPELGQRGRYRFSKGHPSSTVEKHRPSRTGTDYTPNRQCQFCRSQIYELSLRHE
jgi:hypothetical protein